MLDWLATALILASLALAAWCVVSTLRHRAMDLGHLLGLGVVELLFLGQATVAVALLFGGDRPAQLVVFLGYLLTVVLIPPAAALWGLTERSRWGPAVIAAACLVEAAMVVRLQDLWQAGGG